MQIFVEGLSGEQLPVDVSDGATAQEVLDAVQACHFTSPAFAAMHRCHPHLYFRLMTASAVFLGFFFFLSFFLLDMK